MLRPGFEPGLLRPQRSVLTTRRSRFGRFCERNFNCLHDTRSIKAVKLQSRGRMDKRLFSFHYSHEQFHQSRKMSIFFSWNHVKSVIYFLRMTRCMICCVFFRLKKRGDRLIKFHFPAIYSDQSFRSFLCTVTFNRFVFKLFLLTKSIQCQTKCKIFTCGTIQAAIV